LLVSFTLDLVAPFGGSDAGADRREKRTERRGRSL